MRHDLHPRRLLAAALLASSSFAAFAQAPAAPVAEQAPPAASARKPFAPGEQRRDPAARQQRVEQRFAELRQKLRITPQQEGAWTAFTTAVRPPVPGGPGAERPHFDREAFAGLTTPQRIDRMREFRARHAAEADRRGEATKTFYAALTPEQQKTFDQMKPPRGPGFGGHGPHRHGGDMPPPPPVR